MGSWNGTCGISHLPICCGEPVVALLIGKFSYDDESEHSGYCYSNGIYQPLTLPIYCKYDDYGGINYVENTYVLELIRENFQLGETEDVVAWINDQVERGHVSVPHHYLDKTASVGVGLWMVHRKIFDSFQKRPGTWWTGNMPVNELIRKDAQLAIEDIRDPNSDYNKDMDFYRNSTRKMTNSFLLQPRGCFRKTTDYDNYFLYGLNSGSGYAGSGFVTKEFFENVQSQFLALADPSKPDEEALNRLVEDVVGATCLGTGMSNLRIGYMPQSGKGSQSDEYEEYIVLMKTVSEIIKDAETKRKEWDEDFLGFDWT